jgi:hypothetical protein
MDGVSWSSGSTARSASRTIEDALRSVARAAASSRRAMLSGTEMVIRVIAVLIDLYIRSPFFLHK